MKKGRIIYFGLLVVIFLVSTVYFSYAFFTSKNEEHGKLNIVAGDLTYKLQGSDLENNQIVVAANEIKEIQIILSSLNSINSKYELYYTLDKENSNVSVGYSKDTKDSVLGTIDANGTKEIMIVIRNESDISTTVTFSVIGGLINDDLVLTQGNSLNQIVGKYTAYNIGDEITLTDGSKWHVLEASDEMEESIVLLSDYNLNSDGSYNTECGRNINATYTCSAMAFDADNTNIYDETDSNNIGYFIKNVYEPLVNFSYINISIPTVNQIANADSQTFPEFYIKLNNDWLTTTDYWTITPKSNTSNLLWGIHGTDNYIYDYYSNSASSYGIRPTITTSKSNIVKTMNSTTELSIGSFFTLL